MDALALPQNETTSIAQKDRQTQLAESKRLYNYRWFADLIPLNEGGPVPGLDTPGAEWIRGLFKILFGVRANLERVMKSKKYRFTTDERTMPANWIAGLLRTLQIQVLTAYYAYDPGPLLSTSAQAKSVEDFKDLFAIVKMPKFIKDDKALSDEIFSRSFIAGANPAMIKGITSIPSNFILMTAQLRDADRGRSIPYFAHDTIDSALAEGRIFIVDYSEMSNFKPGTHAPGIPKYVYGAMAAFAVPAKSFGAKRPFSVFAIKTGQSPDSLTYTPADAWSWIIAKGMLNASHYTHHETVNHLGWTHLVLEPIVISMRRHLANKHPIYHLLNPHFEGTRAINDLAFANILKPTAAVDRLIGMDLKDAYQFLANRRLAFNFKDHFLPNIFKVNRLDLRSGADLPEYPYRDDSLLLWNAISAWTTHYVNVYYDSDASVLADFELQNSAKEVSDPTLHQGGALKGFGSAGSLSSRKELADICCMTIFTSGPQHAAVNFTQRTDMISSVATPLAGYIPEIKSKNHSELDFIKFLPPVDAALVQIAWLELLGGVFYTKLGHYPKDYFTHPKLQSALTQLEQNLAAIESKIMAANALGTRADHPYIALLPSRVPQSTNI